ncbi:MAG: DoxX family protein [Planctomycetota bacterium]|jgi:putative oxidoreductase
MANKPAINRDLGTLLIRIAVGGLMLPHGIHKLINGLAPIKGMLAGKGLPEFLAYGTPVGEVVAPVLILLGFFTRPAALVLAFTMLMATWLGHGGDAFALNAHGGLNAELSIFYLLCAVALFFTGAGRFSVRKGEPVWD